MYYVYILKSSENKDLHRYIGITKDPIKRLSAHKRNATSKSTKNKYYVYRWLNKVLKDSFNVEMEIIDTFQDIKIIYELEKHYISNYKNSCYKLTNMTEGGETPVSTKEITEKRLKTLRSNLLLDPLHIKRNKKPVSDQHKLNISISKKRNFELGLIKAHNRQKVYKYDLNGNIVKIFECLYDINKTEDFSDSCIRNRIKNKKYVYKEYFWYKEKINKEQVLNLINNK